MNLRPLIPLASLSLAAGMLTGCGSPTDEPSGSRPLTIAELMGQQYYSPDDYRDQDRRLQELVADCMAEEGWRYIPVLQPDSSYIPLEDDELERREREGYGIAYWTLNRDNDIPWIDPNDGWTDPNASYVESLTEAEREAYYFSLYGDGWLYYDARTSFGIESNATSSVHADANTLIEPDDSDIVEPLPVDPWPTDPGEMNTGCFGKASQEVYGNPNSFDDEYWEAMSRFYEELFQRVEADPGIKRLESNWAGCMRSEGFEYSKPDDIWTVVYADFQARHDDIVGDLFFRDPFEGWTQEEIDHFYETATQEQIDAMYDNLYAITEDQRVALEFLLADEIKVAVAEYGCSKTYNDEYQKAYAEIEEAYAVEHRAEIEALVASYTG